MAIPIFLLATGSHLQAQDGPEGFNFSVRTLNPVELPRDTSSEWMEFFGPGLAAGALGVAAPPIFASGLVVGGLLLAPGALILSSIESRKWQRVAGALKKINFEQDLLRALRIRAAGALPSRSGTAVDVELVVNAFGVAGTRPEHACFMVSVDLLVALPGKEILRDRLIISEADRSKEAPPAQCASLDRFAEEDGRLVLDSANEYSEVIAAMAIDRIPSLLSE